MHGRAFQTIGSSRSNAPSTSEVRRSHGRQSLTLQIVLLLGVMLWLSASPARAQQVTPFVSESMLSTLQSTYGETAYQRGLDLNQLLSRLQTADVGTKLAEVNRFFNEFTYQSDVVLWDIQDHWATPLQFLGKHGGDCEDFVVSKYFALRALGLTDQHLSMIYAKSNNGSDPHLVLSYYDSQNSMPLILDTNSVAVRPATAHKRLVPVYGFNESAIFLSKSTFSPGQALPMGQLHNSKWGNMLAAVRRSTSPLRMQIAEQSDRRINLSSATPTRMVALPS